MFKIVLLLGLSTLTTTTADRYQDFIDACLSATSSSFRKIYKENSCYHCYGSSGNRAQGIAKCQTNQVHTVLGVGRLAMFTRPTIVQMIFDHIVTTPSIYQYINSPHLLVDGNWTIEDTGTGILYPMHRIGSPGMPAIYNHNRYPQKELHDRFLSTYPAMLHRWTLPLSSFEDWTMNGIATAAICEYPNPRPRHIQYAIRAGENVQLIADKCEITNYVTTEDVQFNCGRQCSKLLVCNGFIYSATTKRCELTFLLYADCLTFGGIVNDTSDTAYYDRVFSGDDEIIGDGNKY